MNKEWLIKIEGQPNIWYDSDERVYRRRMFCPHCGQTSGCLCYERSTGTSYGYPCQMTEGLVNWADKIFVMDLEQLMFIRRKFPDHEHKVEVVGCSDQYPNDSPQLIRLIEFWAEKMKL